MGELTHLDERGQARMVDVSEKPASVRTAVASARVRTRPEVVELIRTGGVAKGDVLATARIAGIQAAKQTPGLIPLCHPLLLDQVAVDLELTHDAILVRSRVRCTGRTGVEMEALTAAAVAALAVYDMCKALDRGMTIEQVQLEEKAGGKSGSWSRGEAES